MNNKCPDCAKEFETHLVCVDLSSAVFGKYYSGEPLCYRCESKRYEEAVREYELHGTIEKVK